MGINMFLKDTLKSLNLDFYPTDEQLVILDKLVNTNENIIINSDAGSGKTAMLSLMARVLLHNTTNLNITALTFNKKMATELAERLPNQVECNTLHGLLYSYVKTARQKVSKFKREKFKNDTGIKVPFRKGRVQFCDNYKYATIAKAVRQNLGYEYDKIENNLINQLIQDFYKKQLTLDELRKEVQPNTFQILQRCLELGEESFHKLGYISFDEMLAYAIKFADKIKFNDVDYLLLDECQDFSPLMLAGIKTLLGLNTRVIAVGDDAQSIYAFAGAMNDSFSQVKHAFNASEETTSVSFRCPISHIDLIHKLGLNNSISATPNAIEGTIKNISVDDMKYELKVGDLVISRFNNYKLQTVQLHQLAINLLKNGIQVCFLKWKIAQACYELISYLKKENPSWEYMPEYFVKFIEYCENSDFPVNDCADQVFLLGLHYEYFKFIGKSCQTVFEFVEEIDLLYNNKSSESITLCSIHSAKGMQANRVFLCNPETLVYGCLRQGATLDEIKQEYNAGYIALSRSTEDLFIVGGELPENYPTPEELFERLNGIIDDI